MADRLEQTSTGTNNSCEPELTFILAYMDSLLAHNGQVDDEAFFKDDAYAELEYGYREATIKQIRTLYEVGRAANEKYKLNLARLLFPDETEPIQSKSAEADKVIVMFGPLASYQKDDCFYCDERATQQANCGIVSIRCCASEACEKRAAQNAFTTSQRHSKKISDKWGI